MKVLSVNGQLISIGGLIEVSPPNTDICISPTELTNISYTGTTSAISVSGCTWNNTVVTDACDWIVTTSPVSPTPTGVNNNIQICENLTTSCRSGIVCYTPRVGETKCVTVCQSTGDTNIYVTPATISSISASGAYYSTSCIKVCGPTSNSVSVVSACDWIQVCNTPISPSATPGTSSCICVCSNAGAARSGVVCYVPTLGTTRCVTLCQVAASYNCVNICNLTCTGNNTTLPSATGCLSTSGAMGAGEYYCAYFCWYITVTNDTYGRDARFCVCRNGTPFLGCLVLTAVGDTFCNGTFSFCVACGDCINISTNARVFVGNTGIASESYVRLCAISGCANYCLGSTLLTQYSYTCGAIA